MWEETRANTEYQYQFSGFRLTIHHHMDYPKGEWLCSVYGDLSITRWILDSKKIEDAKNEALLFLVEAVKGMSDELKNAYDGNDS